MTLCYYLPIKSYFNRPIHSLSMEFKELQKVKTTMIPVNDYSLLLRFWLMLLLDS